MTATPPSTYAIAQRQCVRLRRIGLTILLVGLVSAGVIYWRGIHAEDADENLALVGYHRAQSQQMGVLFGKSGLMTDELVASLKRPRTQAALIGGTSILLALIFFYLGRPLEDEPFHLARADSAKEQK